MQDPTDSSVSSVKLWNMTACVLDQIPGLTILIPIPLLIFQAFHTICEYSTCRAQCPVIVQLTLVTLQVTRTVYFAKLRALPCKPYHGSCSNLIYVFRNFQCRRNGVRAVHGPVIALVQHFTSHASCIAAVRCIKPWKPRVGIPPQTLLENS